MNMSYSNGSLINNNNTHFFSKSTTSNVSDREMLRIIKEDKNFPVCFSKRVKLGVLVKAYHKYWNCDYTDESDTDE